MIGWLERDRAEPTIELGGQSVPLEIRRHPCARRLTMRLAPDGSAVRVTIPRGVPGIEAERFAASRRAWLERQLAAIPQPVPPSAGSTVPYRGEALRIDWKPAAPRRPAVSNGALVLGGSEASLAGRIERWLRAEALALLGADLDHYCAVAGTARPALALSRARRRWGSCSASGTVRINWRLVMAPDHVRRSVVAHETAHLVHFDHSPAFHRLLGELFEGDLGAGDEWLKRHGRSLYAPFG